MLWLFSEMGNPMMAETKNAEQVPAGGQAAKGDSFGLSRICQIHLEFSARNWEAMQNTRQTEFGGFPGEPRRLNATAQKKDAENDAHQSGFMEFPWVKADLSEGGRTFKNVGIRYKGNFTYMFSMRQLKRSLKIELDHYGKDAPKFYGLRKFNLHAGVMDPTKVREALSYAFFRAAKVAAPRTAFAEVTLTVPGKYEREYVGLFTLTEQVDKPFLKDRFGSDQGLLMKPLLRGPDYLGETVQPYKDRYRPHREPTPDELRRLIEFAKLVNQSPDEQFRKDIDAYLDVDAFLRFIAVNALVVNLDSPFAMPQNYYLYLNPANHKFVFFPWDLDLAMAAWPMGGPPDKQMDLSLLHPHVGEHRLIDRLLAMPEVKERYLGVIKELAVTSFSKHELLRGIDAIEQTTQAPIAQEAEAMAARNEGRGGFRLGRPGGGMGAPDPRTFVEKRTESVAAQLAGRSKGYTPGNMMPPGFGGPGNRGEPPNFRPPGRPPEAPPSPR